MRTIINVNSNKTRLHINKITFISKSLLQVSIVNATVFRKKIQKMNIKI